MVDALTNNQKSEAMNNEFNEISQVLFWFIITFFELEYVWSYIKQHLHQFGNYSWLLNFFNHVLLIWWKNDDVDKCLRQEVKGTPSNIFRVDLFLKDIVNSDFELVPDAHLNKIAYSILKVLDIQEAHQKNIFCLVGDDCVDLEF